MSSLSLPRVLPQRKTSLELERENFEKFQVSFISVFTFAQPETRSSNSKHRQLLPSDWLCTLVFGNLIKWFLVRISSISVICLQRVCLRVLVLMPLCYIPMFRQPVLVKRLITPKVLLKRNMSGVSFLWINHTRRTWSLISVEIISSGIKYWNYRQLSYRLINLDRWRSSHCRRLPRSRIGQLRVD